MDSFILQVTTGLANGGIYAAVGLAVGMIHQAAHPFNFAQGEMPTLSTFLC